MELFRVGSAGRRLGGVAVVVVVVLEGVERDGDADEEDEDEDDVENLAALLLYETLCAQGRALDKAPLKRAASI